MSPIDHIDVVVHPQSIVHSMVEFVDGSTIAQASPPDMRLPISLGLDWPNRVGGVGRPIDWTVAASWTFEPLDEDAFPAVRLAKKVGRAGGTYPAVFNAANEQAVDAFHEGRLSFPGIVELIERVVDAWDPRPPRAARSRAGIARRGGALGEGCRRPRDRGGLAFSVGVGHGPVRLGHGPAGVAERPAGEFARGVRACGPRGCRGSPGVRGPPTGSRRRRRRA